MPRLHLVWCGLGALRGKPLSVELDIVLAAVGVLGMAVATLSAKMRSLPISEPLLGLAAGIVLGPQVTGVLSMSPLTVEQSVLHEGSRVLLAISVMAVALRYPFGEIRRHGRSLLVLLLIVLPVMAVVSAALGWAVLGMPIAAAALFGAAVSPTDPVLASSVVTGDDAERDLPARDRQLLSLESGSNDGLALPLVLVALAVAGPLGAGDAVAESVWQVGGAVIVGGVIGWLGGGALRLGADHGSTAGAPALFFTVVLALGILGVSGLLRVDGVLAVFVGGVVFNIVGTGQERASAVPIDEAINRFAVLPLFVMFGATLPWHEWYEFGWPGNASGAHRAYVTATADCASDQTCAAAGRPGRSLPRVVRARGRIRTVLSHLGSRPARGE